MRKWIWGLLCGLLVLSACSSAEPFQEVEVTAQQLQDKLDDQDDFVLIIEREGCTYCDALNSYIEQTSADHDGLVLYKLDITDFELTRQSDQDNTLTSSTEEGKILLNLAPYFEYTPTMYIIQNGKAIQAGIGYNQATNEVSVWDVDSFVDFNTAETQNFWTFLESGQAD